MLYGPYFCYVSFDLFQLYPSIEIDYILYFHFSSYSFNFGFGFQSLDIFGTEGLIFEFCPLIEIDNIFGFHLGPYTFYFLF